MGAGGKRLAPHDRLERMGGRADDVRAVASLLPGRRRANRQVELARQFLREYLGLPAVAACNAQFPEGSDARHRPGVRARLDAGAEDREHRRILAGEKPRGESGAGPGADRRDRSRRREAR